MLETANARDVSTGPVRKYEFVEGDTRVLPDGRVLHRIRALVDIPANGVKAGDLGGYLQSERNLSHDGTAWVGGEAQVRGRARVYGHALVDGGARVRGWARIFGWARVGCQAVVSGRVRIGDHAEVACVVISGDLELRGKASVCGYGAGW